MGNGVMNTIEKVSVNPYEETHDIIAYNLQQILNATGMNKKELAQKLEVSPATISSWMNPSISLLSEGSETKAISNHNLPTPPITTLKKIRAMYNISIDDFTSKQIRIYENGSFSKVDQLEVQKYQWYVGTYYCYYFDTSSYKGRDNKPDHQALCYGLLHIYEEKSPIRGSDFNVISIFGLKTDEQMMRIVEFLNYFSSPDEVNQLLDDYERMQSGTYHHPISHCSRYFGDLDVTDQHIFINLHYKGKDSASLIFNKPFGHKPEYYGGIGTINSVSRGADSCPCIQYIGLSKAPITASAEEICHNLLLSVPRVKAAEETEQLIEMCKGLVKRQISPESREGFYPISDSQLFLTVKAQFEDRLAKAMGRNLFRCVQINRMDDNDWYHFIKPYVEAAWMKNGGVTYDEES